MDWLNKRHLLITNCSWPLTFSRNQIWTYEGVFFWNHMSLSGMKNKYLIMSRIWDLWATKVRLGNCLVVSLSWVSCVDALLDLSLKKTALSAIRLDDAWPWKSSMALPSRAQFQSVSPLTTPRCCMRSEVCSVCSVCTNITTLQWCQSAQTHRCSHWHHLTRRLTGDLSSTAPMMKKAFETHTEKKENPRGRKTQNNPIRLFKNGVKSRRNNQAMPSLLASY